MAAKGTIDFNDYISGEEALKQAARSVRSLKKDVAELEKSFTNDSGRIKQGFTDIATAIKDLQGKGLKLNLINEADKKLLGDYQRQLAGLKDEKQKLTEREAAQAAAAKTVTDAVKGQTDALKQQKEALRAAAKAGDVDGQKKAAAEIRKTTQENLQLGRALRGVSSALTASVGSYDALVIANGKLLTKLRGLEGGLHGTSKEAKELQAQIAANTATLTAFDRQVGQNFRRIGDYPKLTQRLGAGVSGLVQNLAGAYLGLAGVANGIKAVFDSNVKFSDQAADVRKTTGLTADEFDNLADSLKAVGSRTSLEGLLDIAKVGGQLGYTKEQILGFAKALDVANLALGDDFKGGAEEIATALGKLGLVFKNQFSGVDTEKKLLNIGSALNELGAVGAATAPGLADVAQRVGAVAASAGLGLDQVLSYAAVLEELGYTSEVSGTALNKLFNTLSSKREEAFKIAKLADSTLTLKQFTKLVNNDFGAALKLFLNGLNAGGTSTTKFNDLLSTLKLRSGAAVSVITSLAKNTDLLTERQRVANEQLQAGTSLAAEAATKDNTLASSVDKLKNSFVNLTTSGGVGRFFKGFIDFLNGGILYTEKLNNSLQKTVDTSLNAALASRQLADGGRALVAAYDRLNGLTTKSAAQQQLLTETALELRALFGESVVTINQQTGAYELNGAAVQGLIDKNDALAKAQALTLARQLEGLDKQKKAAELTEGALSKASDARAKQLNSELTDKQITQVERYFDLLRQGSTYAKLGLPVGFTPAQVELVKQLQGETEKLGVAGRKLEQIDKDRATVLAALKRLNIDSAGAYSLLGEATKKQAKNTDDSTEADKEKTKSLADVLKAELELQKARLEAQAKDYDRQAENVANSEAVRTRAIEKAVAVRQQIAKLDELEQINESERRNAKLVNGDKAVAFDRLRITEAFNAKVGELTFGGQRALVALRNTYADQLAEIDKTQLDKEAETLETIGANEAKSAAERQQALLDASAKRIEIILIESDIKRRAAKGDAEVLRQIDADEQAKVDKQLKATRPNNSDLTNADLDKKLAASQLTLEKNRAAGLFTEKQYQRALDELDIAYLGKKLENLKLDNTKQQEAADLDVLINRKKNDRKIKDDEEAKEKRKAIAGLVLEALEGAESTYFSARSARRDAQLVKLQDNYDRERKLAGENEELKAQLEAEFDKKTRAIKRKQAQDDRNAALFQIVINTAVQASETGGFTDPRFYAVLLNGATQTAAVLAKPLPQYFRGREDGPAELALVAERGPELIQEKKTGAFRYVAEQSVTQLGAGDKVFTADATRKILAQAAQDRQAIQGPIEGSRSLAASTVIIQQGRGPSREESRHLQQISKGIDKLSNSLANMKQLTVNVTPDGVDKATMRRGNNLLTMLNKRLWNMGG